MPMFTALCAGCASMLFHAQKLYVSNKAFRELLHSKLYHKNVICVVADESHCNVDW